MRLLTFCTLVFVTFFTTKGTAQDILPYTFINNSEYDDSEIYIGLVGKYGDNVDVWMNLNDYSLVPMTAEDNILDGPSWSTPATWKYPDIFTKLSDITNNIIQIPQGLYGSRIFISFESPMYLHFHETGGYAGANLNSSSDPNDGIRWEIVELTWGDSGLWTNSSRVDAYQYPISLEVSGFTGGLNEPTYTESYLSAVSGNGTSKYGKIGEKLSHNEILSKWDENVSNDYLIAKIVKTHSIDGGPIIEQPSKVEGFPEDILDGYIEEIWSTYTNNDLTIDIGDRGIWVGRVTGDRFDFVDPADGSVATIYGKPKSFDAIEGSGFLAYTPIQSGANQEKYDEDLMIQAQIAAAISRHAIYTDEVGATVQYTHDASRYFINRPYNEYVSFFHNEEISYDSQTYAFAYDDVGDHSSTIQCTFPTSVRVIIGGYDQYVEPTPKLSFISVAPYVTEIENGSVQQFTAQGYDQYSEILTANVNWSTTGGGTISVNGLFTATTIGDFIITAQDGNISRSIAFTVTEAMVNPIGCKGDAATGDYSYVASSDTEDPSITFVPSVAGNGDATCLLFYGTNPDDTFAGFGVTPNTPFQINASEGETVHFYYTYSLVSGGENNTSATRHSFIVGDCEGLLSIEDLDNKRDIKMFPNPVNSQNTFVSGLSEDTSIRLYSLHGQLISITNYSNKEIAEIETSRLIQGVYFVSVITQDKQSKIFKLVVN
ncbi:beta-1,3-glucanase family protein [uncultured Aquimarina sp.]|uniref:beta-1,3-glucanase family protein n=1 Tax=uncultured Aquimarina sp. TaxID=575652 RepID=UPI00262C7CC6|nr:beta-1,3-glucanase family protein [uncultured Aquimarina sp.]